MFIKYKINIIDICDIKFIQYLRIIQSSQRPPSTNRRQSLSLFPVKSADNFAKGKGNNQSCDMKNELIEMAILFFLNFHIAEGQKMRRNSIIFEGYFRVRQLFRVNELLSLLLDIEKYQTLTLALLVCILDAKDPHVPRSMK